MSGPSIQVPWRVRVPMGPRPWESVGEVQIVHVGQSAVLLVSRRRGSHDPILPITSAARGLVPGGVCVPDDAEFAALASAVSRTACVDLSAWSQTPPRQLTVVDLRLQRRFLDVRAVSHMVARLSADAGTVARSSVMDPGPLRALAGSLAGAALNCDDEQVRSLLSRLVGAGPGATPAGDDVVVGVLAALDTMDGQVHVLAEVAAARDRICRHMRGLLAATTSISRHDLAAAINGRFAEHVHALVGALRDPALVPGALASAGKWGATSGLDLACGLAFALQVSIAHSASGLDWTQYSRSSA